MNGWRAARPSARSCSTWPERNFRLTFHLCCNAQTHCRYAKASVQELGRTAYISVIEFLNALEANMNLIQSYKNWRRYNETVRALNRLNTRELKDLGINRADIPSVARAAL